MFPPGVLDNQSCNTLQHRLPVERPRTGGEVASKKSVTAALLSLPALVYAHGGGLNTEGCHTNRRTGDYHCHRTPSVQPVVRPAQAQNVLADLPTNSTAPPDNSSKPTCYTGPRGGTYTLTKRGKKNYGGC